MMFKILIGRVPINPLNFFGSRLRRNIRGKLRLYLSVAKSRFRASFFKADLKEVQPHLERIPGTFGLPLRGFKRLLSRVQ